MKKKNFSEAQIVSILKEAESGVKIIDVCRKYGISDATYYNWKSKYANMSISDIKRLRELEEENRRLKKTKFETITDKFIVEIQEKLNHRPRKVLGYKTPHEVFFARIAEWIDDSKLYYKNSCVAVGG